MYTFKTEKEPFARGFLSCPSEDLTLRTASGLYQYAKEGKIYIDKHNGVPRAQMQDVCVGMGYGMGIWCDENGLRQRAIDDPENANEYEHIRMVMREYNIYSKVVDCFSERERNVLDTATGWGGTWVGHAVPSFADIAKYGTVAVREKIEKYRAVNPDKGEFYDGLTLAMDALDLLGERFHKLALEEAEKCEGDERRRMLRCAKAFEVAPHLPAKDFCDACLVYVMIFTFDGVDSPGHFDWYMDEFWHKTPYAEAREMLEDLWVFFHDTRTWNLCISGSDENWNDVTTDLSYEILDVAAKYKFQTPNITMRCHRGTPEKLIRKATDTIATGIGMPTFYNDEVVCPALERLGIPPCDSHLYVMNGCNQIDIQGKSHMGLEDGEVNMGKVVELVFGRGKCRKTGRAAGIDTGALEDMDTFDKFYAAFMKQLDYVTDRVTDMANRAHEVVYRYRYSTPLRCCAIEGCIEKGLEYKNRGPLYGHGQVLAEGVADAIDSVAAVKKYVYEEKRFTLTELDAALAANFEGYDEIFDTLRQSDLRFGNGIEYVDTIAKDIIDHFNNYLLTIPTARGGLYGGGCSPFTRAAYNGGGAAALPSGKKYEECLYADSIGAEPGKDVEGPTALIRSCLSFDHTLPTSGFILNIKFDKELYNTDAGKDAFIALFHTYFGDARGEGGQQLSVTVVSREELLDAQIHPEDHRDLIVRVGGYSDYFVNIGKDLQDNVIARTDNSI